jgi:Cu/Ag efflux protein CusF
MKRLAAAILLAVTPALAWAQHAHPAPAAPSASQPADAASEGEVKNVDKAGGKIKIKHGEIRNVHMGPMTMTFGVKSPAMLDAVATGDKVRFTVDEVDGALVVTTIRKVK